MVRQWLTGAAVFAVFDLPWVPFYVLVMFIMHPILGFASLLMITIFIIIGIIFSKIIGNQDELLRQEEYETNDFLYGKLRNSEVLSVYALASNFKKTWVENKQNFMLHLAIARKRPMLFKILSSSIDFFEFLSLNHRCIAGHIWGINPR